MPPCDIQTCDMQNGGPKAAVSVRFVQERRMRRSGLLLLFGVAGADFGENVTGVEDEVVATLNGDFGAAVL